MGKRASNKLKILHITGIVGLIIAAWCCQLIAHPNSKNTYPPAKIKIINNKSKSIFEFGSKTSIKAPGLNPKVLNLALKAYKNARAKGIGQKEYLTVVDYSMPSTEKRMWVINMRNNTVVHRTHVAHGKNSGDNYAHTFSNTFGSHMSSLGLFVTGKTYNGRYGNSLELHGLDGKFNSNAYARRIVVHAAHYVDDHIITQIGRLGRSFGCLALSKKVAQQVMHTIKDGSLIFCYYPDQSWLRGSKLLNS